MKSFLKKVRVSFSSFYQWIKQPKILRNIIEFVAVSFGLEIPKVIDLLIKLL